MPCYQVQTMQVNLDSADHDLLEKALKKLGYSVTRNGSSFSFSKGTVSGTYSNNKLNISNTDRTKKVDTDQIKREYSEQVIKKIASKNVQEGWELSREGDNWILTKQAGTDHVQS